MTGTADARDTRADAHAPPGPSDGSHDGASRGPFAGLRVIDFTHVLAGPACGWFLAQLGADVIKLESVGRGDAMRHRGGTDAARARAAMSTAYLTQGGAKRSLALDVASEAGGEVLARLLRSSDVLLENHLPETLERLGLDAPTLERVAPRLVHCAMTGYGRGGPLENVPAYDVNIQAASGLMRLTGTTESGPLRTGAPVIDYATALAAAFAVSAALLERERSGVARAVDVSMLETAHVLMASSVTDFLLTGHAPRPRGNAANSRSPSAGSFACAGGTLLSLGVNEQHQFEALARTLGREAWLDDPRLATREARDAHAELLREELSATLATRGASEWERRLQEARVPAAEVRGLADSLAVEQHAARAFLHADESGDPVATTLPFTLGGERPRPTPRPAPHLGADTDAVLAELGYAAHEILALRDAGAVA